MRIFHSCWTSACDLSIFLVVMVETGITKKHFSPRTYPKLEEEQEVAPPLVLWFLQEEFGSVTLLSHCCSSPLPNSLSLPARASSSLLVLKTAVLSATAVLAIFHPVISASCGTPPPRRSFVDTRVSRCECGMFECVSSFGSVNGTPKKS